MADPNTAQEQRDQIRQQQRGQTGYGQGSDDFAQPGKTGNANGLSSGQDAAGDLDSEDDAENRPAIGGGQ